MKNSITSIFIIFVFITGLCVNAETPSKTKRDKWGFLSEEVADVNGIKISKQDLVSYIQKTGNPRAMHTLSGNDLKSYVREMTEKCINQLLLAQIAASAGFTPEIDLIKKEINGIVTTMSETEKKSFMDYLSSQKMNLDDFCRKEAKDKFQARQFAIDAWIKAKIKKNITVTDKEIYDFYAKAGDIVSASQILIKYDGNAPEAKAAAKKQAGEILKQIKDGEDFRTLAATKSHCNSNRDGLPGALQPFARGQMVQEFEDVAFSLPVGGISDVVETPFGFHIIKVDKKSKRTLPPLNQIKEKIKEELINIKEQDIIIEKLNEAKKHWVIKVTGF